MAKPHSLNRGIDFGRRRPRQHHRLGRRAPGRLHPVADEPGRVACPHRNLAKPSCQRKTRGHRIGGGGPARHHLDQPHRMGGREEMQPQHIARPGRRAGDGIDIQIGGVGRQHRARLRHIVEVAEDRLLDGQILERRFDHQIDPGERVHPARQAQAVLERGIARRFRHLAAFHRPVEIGRDRRPRPGAAVIVAFDQGHRQPGKQHRRGNARAHHAPADDAGLGDRAGRRAGFGDFAHRPLDEEGMDQPGPLRAVEAGVEQRAFPRQPLVQRQGAGGHRLDTAMRGEQMALALPQPLGGPGERRRIGRRRQRPGAARRKAARDHRIGGFDRGIARRGRDHPIDKPHIPRRGRADSPARGDKVERGGNTDQPRCALGSARAGDDPERHLGKAKHHPVDGHPCMGGKRHLKPAAQGDAVQDRHNRGRAVLDHLANLRQPGLRRRLAELANIGARDERPPAPVKRDGPDAPIGIEPAQRRHQPRPECGRGGIHRRVVDRDERGLAVPFDIDRVCHGGLLRLSRGVPQTPIRRRAQADRAGAAATDRRAMPIGRGRHRFSACAMPSTW
jgi:hypothetical protein